ncbi:MAG: cytochrome c peroxidase, partial [Planctomycetota bacterium]|nr:cytochrome c peroxidase [Planctomycetota bacterium]
AWFDELLWDGSADGKFRDPLTGQLVIQSGAALETQSLGPILSDVEMADSGRGWTDVLERLKRVRPLALASDLPREIDRALGLFDTYPKLFERAFGTTEITPVRIAFALATYQRSLVPNATPFDDFMRGDQAAMTAQQVRGMNLFDSTAVCAVCHTPPLFANGGYHSIALRPSYEDPGRYGVTGDPLDLGRFKTPSLRNVALRGRYFHNGTNTIPSLRDSVAVYNGGGGFDNLDPVVGVIDMTPEEIDDITAYLEALTDPRVALELPPFDRPRLRSERSTPNPEPTGTGAVAGYLGREPRVITTAAPFVAADRFRLGAVDVRPGAIAAVRTRLGTMGGATAPGGALALMSLLRPAPVITSDDGQGGGYATATMPIGAEGALRGVSFDAQWLVRDPAAVGGIARSQIVRVTVE